MNRIGWFVVCLVAAFIIPTSLADWSLDKNNTDFKNATHLKQHLETDSIVSLLRQFFSSFLGWFQGHENANENRGRTFGQKRVQLMMLAPMMYKMGVMMTMLVVLTVISLKGLVIGAVLLLLKLSTFITKLHVGPQFQGYGPVWPHQQQPLHVHVHEHEGHNQAYSAWPPISDTIGPDDHYYYKG